MTLYKFTVQDNDGVDHELAALGIEMITNFSKQMDLSRIKQFFPQAPEGVWDRPWGPVDLLIGLDYRHLQPAGGLARDGCAVGGLRLSESKFGCGWILSGTHSSLGVSEHKLTNAARMLMSSVAAETDASGPGGGPPEHPTAKFG